MTIDKNSIKTILATDCGSTTTKAILIEKNEALSSAIQNNFTYICNETLTEQFDVVGKLDGGDCLDLIDGLTVTVSITKK